jgi:hypothetical protein
MLGIVDAEICEVREPHTQLLKWSAHNRHRKHMKHINVNNSDDGNNSISVYLVTEVNVNPQCMEVVASVCTLAHLSCMFYVHHLQ